MTATIDNAGRVVIPKALRDQEIEPVATITVEKRGRFFVAVAPAGTPPVEPAAVDEYLNDLREGRFRWNSLSTRTT
jgi:bifunctional DNA-binding transcriptional regulator/antitoxin component of YhaV-PrlF toxin-antitoxin module